MNRYRKGVRVERELKHMLERHGLVVVRAAGSGNDAPDLVVIKYGKAVSIEVKSGKRYISGEKLKKYEEWALKSQTPFLFVSKLGNRQWVVENLVEIKRTPKGAQLGVGSPPLSPEMMVRLLRAYLEEEP